MLLSERGPNMGGMEILISLDQYDPPQGTIRCKCSGDAMDRWAAHEARFTGWLGLLRAISDALESPAWTPVEPLEDDGRMQ